MEFGTSILQTDQASKRQIAKNCIFPIQYTTFDKKAVYYGVFDAIREKARYIPIAAQLRTLLFSCQML